MLPIKMAYYITKVEFLVQENSRDLTLGARFIVRIINDYCLDLLVKAEVHEQLKEGDKIEFYLENSRIQFRCK